MLMKLRTIQLSSSLLSLPRMKVGIRAGTSVTEIRATPTRAKLLVNASGWNSLPSRQGEHRDERDQHNQDREEDRPTHRAASADDRPGRVPRHLVLAELPLQLVGG